MATYLITGATGYIGSVLLQYIKQNDSNVNIVALVRDKERATNIFFRDVQVLQADLTDKADIEKIIKSEVIQCDYIIHCASVTKSFEMIAHPVEVIESIVNATQNVMELAKSKNVKSIVYLSSMEIYGNIDCSDGHRVEEIELGEIDLFNIRSCYPLGKRMAENICYCYFKEYGVPVKIARLAQTFGHGILPEDNRVFAQFAKSVREGKDIVLHTLGNSMGNYCSIDDAVEGIFTILIKGENGEAYNVVNENNSMTIRQMAELVAEKIAGGKIQVIFDIPEGNPYGYASDTGIRLSGKKLEGLGWIAKDDLIEMYKQICEMA